MKCPKCKTENDQRSVCKKCGLFLYRPDYRNAPKLDAKGLKARDRQIIWGAVKKIARFAGILFSTFFFAFVLYMLLKYLFGL